MLVYQTYRYGPFWVATTLIFVSAATGNYASYIEYNRHHPAGSEDVKGWYYDAKKVWLTDILQYLLFL